ncbi:carbohydrate ABC transporter permease [Paenibacillus qinlingensis]|uniref:carbohydrate ABC transporter permease n=1 Tax=Paenibacillus qinlingensis TaxID=1837343 RepID=UPI001565D549|nr:carbohydrate ABC transporter permease [Paenibacillus qinlingensis]NQX62257.1 carbohydrate ABC transporter permease [Paenibacillus qinlingensis]
MKNNYLYTTILYLISIAVSLVMVIPFVWSLVTSVRPDEEIFILPIRWIPSALTISHYTKAFDLVPFGLYFKNSFYLAFMGVMFNLLLGSLSGYAFAKLRFKGRDTMFKILLAAMMIPGVVTLIPQFFVLKHIPFVGGNDWLGGGGNGLLNTFWAVILPGASGSFAVFFMRQFFVSLPSDLQEVSRIEGSGELRIYWNIYMPLAKPALATLGIFTFQAGWNSFLGPLIMLNDPAKKTIQLGLAAFTYNKQVDFGPLMAGALIAVVPILILFLLLQKYFVQGIAFTGTKG